VIVRRVVALALPLLLWSSAALAAEGEKAFSVGVDYSHWNVVQESHPGDDDDSITADGAQLALDYEYGWNDTLWLRASGSGGYFSVPKGSAWAAGGTLGITYAIDVIRWVPFVQLGAGALVVGGDGVDVEVKPVVELGVGLAALQGRTWSWGVVARVDTMFSQATFLTVGPRLTWRWGFF
jgi:hypothetical protein